MVGEPRLLLPVIALYACEYLRGGFTVSFNTISLTTWPTRESSLMAAFTFSTGTRSAPIPGLRRFISKSICCYWSGAGGHRLRSRPALCDLRFFRGARLRAGRDGLYEQVAGLGTLRSGRGWFSFIWEAESWRWRGWGSIYSNVAACRRL